MERAAADWSYDRLHEERPYHDGTWSQWSKERSLSTPFHYRDGVQIYVSTTDDDPDDLFTTEATASPWAPTD